MEWEHIALLILWILGGDCYIDAIRGYSNLTNSAHLLSDFKGKLALAFHFIFWPAFALFYMIRRMA